MLRVTCVSPRARAHLDTGVDVLEEARVARVRVVPVDLERELGVEVLPLLRRVDQVRVDSLPRLVVCERGQGRGTERGAGSFHTEWVVHGSDVLVTLSSGSK